MINKIILVTLLLSSPSDPGCSNFWTLLLILIMTTYLHQHQFVTLERIILQYLKYAYVPTPQLSLGCYLKSMFRRITLRAVWCVYNVIPLLCVWERLGGVVLLELCLIISILRKSLLCSAGSDDNWQQPLMTYCNIFENVLILNWSGFIKCSQLLREKQIFDV